MSDQKDTLEKGVWYELLYNNHSPTGYFIKYNYTDHEDVVRASEYTNGKNHFKEDARFGEVGKYQLKPVSEGDLSSILPKSHPDRNIKPIKDLIKDFLNEI